MSLPREAVDKTHSATCLTSLHAETIRQIVCLANRIRQYMFLPKSAFRVSREEAGVLALPGPEIAPGLWTQLRIVSYPG